jgi:hypothetical protein
MWQGYRDSMQYAYQAGENDLDRENRLAIAKIQENATIKAAEASRTAAAVNAMGSLTASLLGKTTLGQAAVDTVTNIFKGMASGTAANPFAGFDISKFNDIGLSAETLGVDDATFGKLVEGLSDFEFSIAPGG